MSTLSSAFIIDWVLLIMHLNFPSILPNKVSGLAEMSTSRWPISSTVHKEGNFEPSNGITTNTPSRIKKRLTGNWLTHPSSPGENHKETGNLEKAGRYSLGSHRQNSRVYIGAVKPIMAYAAAIWNTASVSAKAKPDRVHNLGLRIILEVMKSTPIRYVEKTATVQPSRGYDRTRLFYRESVA